MFLHVLRSVQCQRVRHDAFEAASNVADPEGTRWLTATATLPTPRIADKAVIESTRDFVKSYGQLCGSRIGPLWPLSRATTAQKGGATTPVEAGLGQVMMLGEIKVPIEKVAKAARLRLEMKLLTAHTASFWDILVYPKETLTKRPAFRPSRASSSKADCALSAGFSSRHDFFTIDC